jgi:hypothetical protein
MLGEREAVSGVEFKRNGQLEEKPEKVELAGPKSQ